MDPSACNRACEGNDRVAGLNGKFRAQPITGN